MIATTNHKLAGKTELAVEIHFGGDVDLRYRQRFDEDRLDEAKRWAEQNREPDDWTEIRKIRWAEIVHSDDEYGEIFDAFEVDIDGFLLAFYDGEWHDEW
jgi:hypothetical protein